MSHMKKPHVLITAGPTREYIDPIRFITNESSGYLGIVLAKEAVRRGCAVTLLFGGAARPVGRLTVGQPHHVDLARLGHRLQVAVDGGQAD